MKIMSKIKFFGHTKDVVYISESEHCNCTQLLLICFPEVIKRIAVHQTSLIIDDNILSSLLYL